MARVRGSTWSHPSKKKGYAQSIGSYAFRSKHDRYFVLTAVRTGKTKVYESPEAAEHDGWTIVRHGK